MAARLTARWRGEEVQAGTRREGAANAGGEQCGWGGEAKRSVE